MDEEAPKSLAATTKARESTFTLRKRQRSLGSSGKLKENASSPFIDEKKKMKENPQSRSGLKFQSNSSGSFAAEVKENLGSSCFMRPSFDAEKNTPLPAGNNVVLKESKRTSSSGSLAELASLDGIPVIESLVSSHSSEELAVPAPSNAGSMANLPNSNPEILTHPAMNYLFVKKISVWSALLSLDIFKAMPQPPHFRPLEQIQENCREGIAIGLMVSFASIADNMRTLNVDDDTIDGLANRLDGLEDYEQHGFDIKFFKNQLENLIQVKRTLDDYSQEKAEIESAIAKIRNQRSEAASEAKELEGIVLILQKKQLKLWTL